ncbi:radical SAM protein [Anaeromicropila populeti]|uniref:Radical SAM additional 4Fe4S-binding SPASM domain-containing protein n=1 Tax=Anaeromicropila populeti TaxID=37658 RepID=A0A1I6JMP5_9FIRM|nr:radical SAM protein [Anaeromicropila populeti]SFR80243.1 radical SAM additional 4Fe4S-binding SPASM domain-containing protein [Anaeromicropila populeti]
MEKLRVLWLEDGQCILFNALDKRISKICPSYVGKAAEEAASGKDLAVVIEDVIAEKALQESTEKLITYIAGSKIEKQKRLPVEVKRFNRTLVLCVSALCNLRCVYCSGNAGNRSDNMMSWDLAKDSIDYFFDHCSESGPYTLQFHGAGEPMTNPDIVMKSVEYARQLANQRNQKLLTRMSTNGIFSSDVAEWMAENMNHVSLSFDGPPEIHNKQRPKRDGRGSYDTVVNTIKILTRTGSLRRMNTVVTNEGTDRLEEIIRHVYGISQVKEIRILPMEYCGRCEVSGVQPINLEKYKKSFENIIPVAQSLGVKIITNLEQLNYYTEHYCGACGFNMCVTPAGVVSTCVEAMDEREEGIDELFIGKYDKEIHSFSIDWDKVFKLRSRTYYNLDECGKCVFRTNCAGNCLIRSGRKNKTVMSVDKDACDMTKLTLTKQLVDMAKSGETLAEKSANGEKTQVSFQELVDLSRKVAKQFDQVELRPWTIETMLLELTKQVGDLTKYFMTFENYYLGDRKLHPNYRASKDSIGNELADIMHAVIRIADYYQIDLEDAFQKARMAELNYCKRVEQNI